MLFSCSAGERKKESCSGGDRITLNEHTCHQALPTHTLTWCVRSSTHRHHTHISRVCTLAAVVLCACFICPMTVDGSTSVQSIGQVFPFVWLSIWCFTVASFQHHWSAISLPSNVANCIYTAVNCFFLLSAFETTTKIFSWLEIAQVILWNDHISCIE